MRLSWRPIANQIDEFRQPNITKINAMLNHQGCGHRLSNGQTEGQVNRLKLVKRQAYGRAKVDLIRCRMLQAA